MANVLQRAIDAAQEAVNDDEAAIAAAEEALTQAIHRLEVDRARLDALVYAQSLQPASNNPTLPSFLFKPETTRKGRTPGSVSGKWKQILRDMIVLFPDGASEDDLVEIAVSNGMETMRPKDTRQRMRKYLEFGYVAQIGDRWKVTNLAVQKFDLASDTEKAGLAEGPALTVSGGG